MKNEFPTVNPQQLKFCQNYLLSGDGTDAAKKAGYSEHSAHVTASKLLKHAGVKAYLATQQTKAQKKFEITVEDKMQELWEVVTRKEVVEQNDKKITLRAKDADRIAAINVLNRMQGHEQVKDSGNGNTLVTVVVALPDNGREIKVVNQ